MAETLEITKTAQSLSNAISKMNSFQRRLNIEQSDWLKMCPNVLIKFQEFRQQIQGKRVAIFLDYDGTLTPIVSNPDQALMSAKMREVVNKLSQVYPVSIISGRSREKVESFVKLKQIFYSGSHGFDIVGPQVGNSSKRQSFTPASDLDDVIDQIYKRILRIEHEVQGAKIEHNKYCLSVHYRNVKMEDWEIVLSMLENILKDYPNFKYTQGRKVLEVRPEGLIDQKIDTFYQFSKLRARQKVIIFFKFVNNGTVTDNSMVIEWPQYFNAVQGVEIDWDKGKALMYLLQQLGLQQEEDVYPIYLGDDRTDEDAFQVLNNYKMGLGILISDKPKHTQARYFLSNPDEVLEFLHKLALLGQLGSENGWYKRRSCPGWTCQFDFEQAYIQKLGIHQSGSQVQLSDLQSPSSKYLYNAKSLRRLQANDLINDRINAALDTQDSSKIIDGFDPIRAGQELNLGRTSELTNHRVSLDNQRREQDVLLDEYMKGEDFKQRQQSFERLGSLDKYQTQRSSRSIDESPGVWKNLHKNERPTGIHRTNSNISSSHSVPLSTSYQNLAELNTEIQECNYNQQESLEPTNGYYENKNGQNQQQYQTQLQHQNSREALQSVPETQILQQKNSTRQKGYDQSNGQNYEQIKSQDSTRSLDTDTDKSKSNLSDVTDQLQKCKLDSVSQNKE